MISLTQAVFGGIGIAVLAFCGGFVCCGCLCSRCSCEDEHARQAWDHPGKYPAPSGKDRIIDEEDLR